MEGDIPGIVDDSWEANAVMRARRLYPNTGTHSLATLMARTHRFAIEYMEQCPAVVVYASWGSQAKRPKERLMVASRFGSAVSRGLKLRDMMAEFNGPLQVRGLYGSACIPSNYPAILDLRKIAPSDLAQAIPEKKGQQLAWLRVLRMWRKNRKALSFQDDRRLWEWIVKAGSVAVREGFPTPDFHVGDIIDMVVRGQIPLNPEWTFRSAVAATDRWHRELAQRHDSETFLLRHGVKFDEERSYAPLPTEAAVGEFNFVALRSGLDLFLEGKAMHHCVASYVRDVMIGGSRIYSIRRGEDRVATMELLSSGRRFNIAQLKGRFNATPTKPVKAAAESFLLQVNAAGTDEAAARRARTLDDLKRLADG